MAYTRCTQGLNQTYEIFGDAEVQKKKGGLNNKNIWLQYLTPFCKTPFTCERF